MIRYAMTVSNSTKDEQQELTSYGLRAMNEKGEELLSIPNISTREEDVAYLLDHFNQVRIQRNGHGITNHYFQLLHSVFCTLIVP